MNLDPDNKWQNAQNGTPQGASELKAMLAGLQARADNAYCDYIELCRRNECLGWEAKVEKGIFGAAELQAHKDAAEKLGRHRALQEAVNLLTPLVTASI